MAGQAAITPANNHKNEVGSYAEPPAAFSFRSPIFLYVSHQRRGRGEVSNDGQRSSLPGRNEAWPRLQHAVGQENHARPWALTLGVPQ
ncbi:hypothetical protein ANTQUA_LOCUS82 [Anthophora quadrimaculata]